MAREFWSHCAERAEHLARTGGPSASLLAFYARVLDIQQQIDQALGGEQLTGDIEHDAPVLCPQLTPLLRLAIDHGPQPLAEEAVALSNTNQAERGRLLTAFWRDRSDQQFFPKAIVQPYARLLATSGKLTGVMPSPEDRTRCPHCGGRPQLSVMRRADDALADGGGRTLLCATCVSEWRFNRMMCASCGEDDERNLAYFHAPEYDHLRVDICRSCNHYVKTVDLTRFGLAAPLVDEAVAAALDLWARERGYEKIELNLLGL